MAISALLCLIFAWYIFFYPFTLDPHISFYLKWVSCTIYRWVTSYNLLCQSLSLISMFKPFTFNAMVDISLESAILLFYVWSLCTFISFSFSCLPVGSLNICLEFHFNFAIMFLSVFLCNFLVFYSCLSIFSRHSLHYIYITYQSLLVSVRVKYKNFISFYIPLLSPIYNIIVIFPPHALRILDCYNFSFSNQI